MNTLRLTIVIVVGLSVAACSSVTEVSTVAPNTYLVGAMMGGQLPSWSEVKALALKRANAHCESLGQTTLVDRWETHGARGWTPLNAELTFRCVPRDSSSSVTP